MGQCRSCGTTRQKQAGPSAGGTAAEAAAEAPAASSLDQAAQAEESRDKLFAEKTVLQAALKIMEEAESPLPADIIKAAKSGLEALKQQLDDSQPAQTRLRIATKKAHKAAEALKGKKLKDLHLQEELAEAQAEWAQAERDHEATAAQLEVVSDAVAGLPPAELPELTPSQFLDGPWKSVQGKAANGQAQKKVAEQVACSQKMIKEEQLDDIQAVEDSFPSRTHTCGPNPHQAKVSVKRPHLQPRAEHRHPRRNPRPACSPQSSRLQQLQPQPWPRRQQQRQLQLQKPSRKPGRRRRQRKAKARARPAGRRAPGR